MHIDGKTVERQLRIVLLEPDLEKAESHIISMIQNGNKKEVLYWIRKFAVEGSSVAQLALGVWLLGCSEQEEAEYWLLKSADQGYDKAISILPKVASIS